MLMARLDWSPPAQGADSKFLRGDGAWASPPTPNKVTNASHADEVPWSGVSGKPGTFPPSSHSHDRIAAQADSREYNTAPSDYINTMAFRGIKLTGSIGLNLSNAQYAYVLGLRGWSDVSGGGSHELAFTNAGVFLRQQSGENNYWGSWYQIITTEHNTPINRGGTGATSAQGARTNLGFSGSPMYALWSGNNNLTSQLTLSGLGANPGYNTFIFIFEEGYAGYRIPIAIPFSIIPSSKSLIFEVGSGSTGAFSRFYAWKDASNLYLQQYGYIGSGGSLRTVYGRY